MASALAEVVANLRAELNEAMQASADEDLLFELGTVELQLTVGVDKETKPGRRSSFGCSRWVPRRRSDRARPSGSS
ncbi:MAG: hypothetical protein V7646_2768 [Pseudonocardia sp.]|jgi:hypothetical protein